MHLVGIFLNYKDCIKAVNTLIKNNIVEYSIPEKINTNMSVSEINTYVDYLYLYEGYDKEFEENGGYLV